MIEFKADCGHTVRARDEDAGGAVRCSYCGRTVAVPDTDAGLDFLYRELPAQGPEEPRKRWQWPRKKAAAQPAVRKPVPSAEINPFGIVVRLCYFALLIIILVVLWQYFVQPMFSEDQRARRLAGDMPARTETIEKKPEPAAPSQLDRGLLTNRPSSGIYVASLPSAALAFAIEESRAPKSGRIYQLPGVHTIRTDSTFDRLPDGTYLVELAFPWNDPGLNDPALPGYSDYLAFRKALERASDAQRKQLQEDYFVPDEAVSSFVAEADDQVYFVRQYRGVTLQQARSKGVRALFLPRLGKGEGRPFSLEPLLHGYIPASKRYGFDEKLVRAELNFYDVPAVDQQVILDALARAGAVPYAGKDKKVRMFRIDIHGGGFTTKVIREGGT